LLHTLQSIGVRVPEDIAVMGCDDIESGRVVSPALSTIHQPVDKIAELAFGTLQRRIRGDNLPPCEILVDAPVVVRKSTLGTNESAHSGKRTCKCGNERKKS
jgi:DNA-binding LacI/PurR family transcriptional regulator